MQDKIERIANVIRKVAIAASSQLNKDCLWHTLAAKYLLAHNQIESHLKIGYAAWRIGQEDGAVVTHMPIKGYKYQPHEIPFHCWLEIDDFIFDVTTYQLEAKMKMLDAADNSSTEITWCPEFLYDHVSNKKPFVAVQQLLPGMYFYEEQKWLSDYIKYYTIVDRDPVLEDAEILLMAFHNPSVLIIGPNHIKGE